MKHTEYIIPIGEDARDYDEMFIGVIRRQPELVRCRDCRFFERDHFDSVYIPTETGEAEKMPLITAHEICTKWGDGCKTAEDGYCFLAERKEE